MGAVITDLAIKTIIYLSTRILALARKTAIFWTVVSFPVRMSVLWMAELLREQMGV